MKVNKKMLQQQLSVESGRVVTLADLTLKMKKPYQFDSENEATDIPQKWRNLTNLTVKMKQPISRNDLVHVVEFLEKDYSIRIFRNIDREIREIHRRILVILFLSMHPYIIL